MAAQPIYSFDSYPSLGQWFLILDIWLSLSISEQVFNVGKSELSSGGASLSALWIFIDE